MTIVASAPTEEHPPPHHHRVPADNLWRELQLSRFPPINDGGGGGGGGVPPRATAMSAAIGTISQGSAGVLRADPSQFVHDTTPRNIFFPPSHTDFKRSIDSTTASTFSTPCYSQTRVTSTSATMMTATPFRDFHPSHSTGVVARSLPGNQRASKAWRNSWQAGGKEVEPPFDSLTGGLRFEQRSRVTL